VRIDRREHLYDQLLRETRDARTPFDQEALAASLNLALTSDVQQSFLFKRLNQFGLVRSSFNLLALLRYAHPEGLQLSEIGDLLITSRANITGLVDHLQDKGYLKRVVDSRDRRVRVAKLTKRGEMLVDEVMPGHKDRSIALFSHFSLEQLRLFTQMLRELRHSPALAQSEGRQDALYEPVFADED
jgi:MarR family transcriptional regulator, 2-MHQ and catechol-resistance regulon repressor